MSGRPGHPCIAICAAAASALELLAELVRGAGCDALCVHGLDDAALAAARDAAHAFLLHSADGPVAERLACALAARPVGRPLIVVGHDPMRRAAPTLWLPTVPPGGRLVRLIRDLLDDEPTPGAPSRRRKTDRIIGESSAIRHVVGSLDRLAAAQTPVLITGESGVGKELVARSLHDGGPRAGGPFIALNCAAIPEALIEAELFGHRRGAFTGAVAAHAGAVEAAHKGTLFLDEIGEMPLAMQAKLLRVFETGEVQRIGSTERRKIDFRLVSATNRNLEQAVADGRFREDLYYRVHVYPVRVPPLRERLEDLPRLVDHFLAVIGAREQRPAPRITTAAVDKLMCHRWPGNVRELVNVLERAALVAGGPLIDEGDVFVPDAPQPAVARETLVAYRDAKATFEREYYGQLMRAAGGNVSLAAKLGDKTRKEIYDALRRCGLDAHRTDEPTRRRA